MWLPSHGLSHCAIQFHKSTHTALKIFQVRKETLRSQQVRVLAAKSSILSWIPRLKGRRELSTANYPMPSTHIHKPVEVVTHIYKHNQWTAFQMTKYEPAFDSMTLKYEVEEPITISATELKAFQTKAHPSWRPASDQEDLMQNWFQNNKWLTEVHYVEAKGSKIQEQFQPSHYARPCKHSWWVMIKRCIFHSQVW